MRRKKPIIGVDIGGTKIRSILWDGKRAIKIQEFKTPKNLTAFKKALRKLIDNSIPITRIGIGVPGAVSGNKILFCPNIKYLKKVDVRSLMLDVGRKTIKLDNDARCFARAECGKKRCFAVTLGTGVGRAFAKNGKVLKIKKLEYPERWEKDYQKIRNSKNNRALVNFLAKKLTGRFKEYNPATIIIGGGVSERKGFLAELRKASRLPVKKSKLGKNAAAIGAVLLFQ